MLTSSGVSLCVSFLVTVCLAQDPVLVNPKIAIVIFENENVRILRVRYGPHESLPMHSHPAKVVVRITKNDTRITQIDGSTSEVHTSAGEALWREPSQHAVENLSDEPMENIEVELKRAPAKAIAVPITRLSADTRGEPVPIELEPHHLPIYKNQYVCILDVKLNPGESTRFHTHSHPSVAVRLSDAVAQSQNLGNEWQSAVTVKRGDVAYPEAKVPYTHRVKNIGSTPFHVIDIELLQ